jgi:hypothetical protein
MRARVFASVLLVLAGSAPLRAGGELIARRVIVVLTTESVEGFASSPALRWLVTDAALGILDLPTDRGRAIEVLGSGSLGGGDPATLARALSFHGVPFVARAEAGRALGAANIRIAIDRAVPGDLAAPSLAVLDGASLVPAARALLQRDDVLLVLGIPPGGSRGVIAAHGLGYAGRVSVRASAIVGLHDVAPSILAMLGIEPPTAMTGRAFRVEADRDPRRTMREASRSRSPVPAMVAIMMGALAVGFGRRRRRLRGA